MPGDTDQELLQRYGRGDARAMDLLVERHAGAVYAFVRRMVGDGPGLDDLVQEVWLKVLRGGATFDGRSRFTTWLFALTRNACLDCLRRRRRAPPEDEAPPDGALDPGPPVIDRVARRELSGFVEQALEALSLEQREVFLLREQTDLTFLEISTALGVPRETVKSRMRYALAHVRRFLRERLGLEVPGVDCETYQADLPDLLYGELDAEARPVVEDHRRGCAPCDALTRELEAVKGALPALRAPPLLALRLKLAARDELLARGGGPPAPPPPDAALRLVSAVILAGCVGVVGFALGIAWSPRPRHDARLRLPASGTDLPAPPPWVDPDVQEGPEGPRAPRVPPRAPEAWQRVLFDTASEMQQKGELRQASDFYTRALNVAPEGPLAAAAMVGRAEALLGLNDRPAARALLEAARRGILGGRLPGSPNLLQRIAELAEAAER